MPKGNEKKKRKKRRQEKEKNPLNNKEKEIRH